MRQTEINILGKKYAIDYSTDVQMGGAYGASNRQKQKISLSEDQGPDQLCETLLHEVMHIISGELALTISEEDIQRLAAALYSLGIKI